MPRDPKTLDDLIWQLKYKQDGLRESRESLMTLEDEIAELQVRIAAVLEGQHPKTIAYSSAGCCQLTEHGLVFFPSIDAYGVKLDPEPAPVPEFAPADVAADPITAHAATDC